jgi:hypothetical protein
MNRQSFRLKVSRWLFYFFTLTIPVLPDNKKPAKSCDLRVFCTSLNILALNNGTMAGFELNLK